jgi:thioesterase domain-containing protein
MASKMLSRGLQPGPVILLDSYVAEEEDAPPTQEEVDRFLLAQLLQGSGPTEPGVKQSEARPEGIDAGGESREARLERLWDAARRGGGFPPDLDRRRVSLLTEVMGRHLEALYRYRPRPQGLEAWLLRASSPPPPGTPDHGDLWRRIARKGFQEVRVSGDHFSILRGDSAARIARELLERLSQS